MKKLELVAVAMFVLCSAHAMPTRQEIADTRPLVEELMAPTMAEYKAKAKTEVEVADVSVAFAESSKNDAAKFLFLRRAVMYYVKGGEFGKAADTVDAIKAKVKNVPPSEIVSIISGPLDRDVAQRAPRLKYLLQLAQTQVRAAKDVNRLSAQLRKVSTDAVRRQYAEALALSSDWKRALSEFAKVDGEIGKMAKADANGAVGSMELGDFWWGYKPSYVGTEGFFRDRAAEYYRKAIAEGKVDGLKKTLVEQRLASLALPDVADVAPGEGAQPSAADSVKAHVQSTQKYGSATTKQPRGSKKDPSGLVARWSFAEDLSDSVGGVLPSKSENVEVANGVVSLRSGSPLEFPAGTVPLAPFTLQVWASASDKGRGEEGDMIFNIASSPDSDKDSVCWKWKRGKWATGMCAFGAWCKEYKNILDGKMHLYTVTCEKEGKGLLVKFYQDDTCFGSMTTKFAWKKPPMLILGGFIAPTYDEVRIYSRAFAFPEIIASTNLGPDNLPEAGKGK